MPERSRLSLQRLPVGQAELKALGSVCLAPKRMNWYIALRVVVVVVCECSGMSKLEGGLVNQGQRRDTGLENLKVEYPGFTARLC